MWLQENAITMVAEVTVDHSSTGQTTLYTVPSGKVFTPLLLIIIAAGDEGTTDITVGKTASWDDWLGANGLYAADVQLDNLDAAGDYVALGLWAAAPANPPVSSGQRYSAGEVIKVDVVVGNGNAGNTYKLLGILEDA